MYLHKNLWIAEELLRWIVDQLSPLNLIAEIGNAAGVRVRCGQAGIPVASSWWKRERIHANRKILAEHRLATDRWR